MRVQIRFEGNVYYVKNICYSKKYLKKTADNKYTGKINTACFVLIITINLPN